MTDVLPGGHRRIDRVLDEGYLAGIAEMTLQEVRDLRAEADQEETDLSYLRRLLQGRLDILRAEVEARSAGKDGSARDLVAELSRILTTGEDGPRPTAQGLGRHRPVEPTPSMIARRRGEALLADIDISDPSGLDEAGIAAASTRLVDEEASVSVLRKRVQQVLDACSAEITARYASGRADVGALLAE